MSGVEMPGIGRRMASQARLLWRGVASGKSRRAFLAASWRRLADNRVPVAVCLALAMFIYFVIHDRPTVEFVRPVAVNVRGAPEGIRIGIDPPTVRVVFKGEREDMLGLDMKPPVIYVNYPGAQARKAGSSPSVKIRKRDVRLSGMRGFGSVSVERLDPEKVTLVEDKIETLSFDIEPPKLEGAPSSGLRAEVMDYEPKRTAVTGGGRRLKGWEGLGLRLRLAPVSVDGLGRGEFSRMAEILPPSVDDAMDISLPTSRAVVTVRVSPQREHLTLEDIPVRLSFPQGYAFPAGVEVEPRTVDVTLVGAKEQLREVVAGDVVVYAELADGAPPLSSAAAQEVPLVARIPQDISILEVNLSQDKVRLMALAPEDEAGGTAGVDVTPVQEAPSATADQEESVGP